MCEPAGGDQCNAFEERVASLAAPAQTLLEIGLSGWIVANAGSETSQLGARIRTVPHDLNTESQGLLEILLRHGVVAHGDPNTAKVRIYRAFDIAISDRPAEAQTLLQIAPCRREIQLYHGRGAEKKERGRLAL